MAHALDKCGLHTVRLLCSDECFLQLFVLGPDFHQQASTPHDVNKQEKRRQAYQPVPQPIGKTPVCGSLLAGAHQTSLRRQLIEVGILNETVNGVHLDIAALHGLKPLVEIALQGIDADDGQGAVNGQTALMHLIHCGIVVLGKSESGHFQDVIIPMIELPYVLTPQIQILLVDLGELLRVAYNKIKVSLHGQRLGEIVDILQILGGRYRLFDPLERLLRIFQAEHLRQIQIDTHRELHVTVAHFLQSLHEISLCATLVMTVTIDIAIQACSQIVIVAGTVFPDLMVQCLCKVDGTIELVMP